MGWILEVGVAAALGGSMAGSMAQAGAVACPAPRQVTERFTSAACEACWSVPTSGTTIDWVLPAADDAPMALAALPEAARRAPGVPADRTLSREWLLPAAPPVKLRVVDGLAWNGYVALQLEAERRAPHAEDLVAWLALVQDVEHGRRVVRSLVGPLSLGELARARRTRHLVAVRVPSAVDAGPLSTIGWVESADGRMLAFAASRCQGLSRRGRSPGA